MTKDHEGILQRLEKLERQNRRMKLAGLGALIIAGAILLMGQTSGPRALSEVKANSFLLVDGSGRTRAVLHMMEHGGPGLALYDENGKARAVLGVVSDGTPVFGLYGANGNMRATLTAFSDGSKLDLFDANGKTRAGLAVASAGSATLSLFDANEKPMASLVEILDGSELALTDANGFETDIGITDLITQMTGETHKTSAASIVLLGKDKKVLWSAPPQD